ncbi:magnesium chelatase subunit H [Maritimibacter sp. UBA3975]|uniref:magnesium chelatase subunit H n=1 Tax=Maritimibacter sp. UBA3975 TaxID=1946833 RepID=UPI000C09CA36|nr:magnesium chelatase subunit H [Maritimibacter sp. UBA3975]MAM62908.1 magnesium chelatase subunit H [Maritimibacter sp.]|tara:strand:- start:14186 stop:17749 length:3564 start_codon:yes stop_codon:yes gene_type:complete
MRDDVHTPAAYRIALLTLDQHAAGPSARAALRLSADFPGLEITVHAAAEWGEDPAALDEARASIAQADIVVTSLLFLEDHIEAILPDLERRRDDCDAMIGIIADAKLVRLTRMGTLDMSAPESGTKKLLKMLRGGGGAGKPDSGARKMRMLRRLPRILRLIPGKAQDLRAWFLVMQYWLGSSDENIEAMIRHLISRYCRHEEWRGAKAPAPVEYPETGLYHPDLSERITTDPADLPSHAATGGTVGILMMRSYVLSGDTAHYDAVIRDLEARGLRVLPAFAGGLDSRPAIEGFFLDATGSQIDTLLSLTGFSLVGGPAYNDNDSAVALLKTLDVPYVAAHPLEFRTLGEWAKSDQGLGPVETTMLVALPELDGATNPVVFAGRHSQAGCDGCARACRPTTSKELAPCHERVAHLGDRVARLAALRRSRIAERRVGIVLFGFPPNAGAAGTAAYLDVFRSLHNTLHAMAAQGYDVTPPPTVEDLREAVLEGSARQYGQDANVAAHVPVDTMVAKTPWLAEIEAQWGPAPGRHQSDGRGVFVLGANFGKVFVGLQPAFGYEGDPMRLLFERGFAPTHAFVQFYQWLRHDFGADVLLHFGMHGALEFMPGKQTALSGQDWPDRLIGDMPNVYLYAANNPSEATLAKRRSGAVTVSHLTPPLASAGLYKGLAELKDSVTRWRETPPDASERDEIAVLIVEQSAAIDLDGSDPDALWRVLLDTESALIPEGLHVVGAQMSDARRAEFLAHLDGADAAARAKADALLQTDSEIPALLHALGGGFTAPVPGGDLIRSPDILPTGRNIHAFDPFRMPTAHACRKGAKQAQLLLDTHASMPRSIALVLWGSDNIKSDGSAIAQALALMGATPRFDSFGRLCGADLLPLAELGRPRIDVVMTLSGIFRDLLPLQTKLLAEAALKAATADEPTHMNFIRAHALAHMDKTGCDLETAALRVFSNAEGAYGSNVNMLVDSSAFTDEDELANAYEARKSFAYGVDGKPAPRADLLQAALADVDVAYQNLESVELGVTTVDHYFDTLGGIARAVKRARGGQEAAIYISDTTRGTGKIRTLADQLALETRSRSLNPKFHEALLEHGAEGVRQIEAHVTNVLGWSATTGQVQPWVYQRISETFMLDKDMRDRMAALNPVASSRMANRLLEASDRTYWTPDDATLASLREAADALEDRVEGVAAE